MTAAPAGAPGEMIGPYQVVRELGRGGMGVVLEVRHPQVDRRLALKLILGDADDMALKRFGQEAQVMARVRHRSVVGVHDLGRCSRGPYLVSDLVEGTGLDRRCGAGPLEPREAAALVAELADGLGALHAAKVLHRDLKPANVIVRPDGVPVVLDLGIARDESAERLTRTGALMGTPAYMSPEQCDGAKDIDGRTDVYGLGAILFECLVGTAPYDQRRHPMAIVKDVLTRDPEWPKDARRRVPPELQAVVIAAMARERQARHPTAHALRDDLRAWLGGQQVWAVGTAYYERALARRRRVALATTLALAAGALLLVLVPVAASVAYGGRETPEREVVPPPVDLPGVALDELRRKAEQEGKVVAPGAAMARWEQLREWARQNPTHARVEEARRLMLAERTRFGLSLPGRGPQAPLPAARPRLQTQGLAIDARRVLLVRGDGLVGVWDALDGQVLWHEAQLGGPAAFDRVLEGTGPHRAAVSPDRTQAAIVGGFELRRIDLATGAQVGAPVRFVHPPLAVAWGTTHLLVGGPVRDGRGLTGEGWAALLPSGGPAPTAPVPPLEPLLPFSCQEVAFSPDGRRAVAATGRPVEGLQQCNAVDVWEVAGAKHGGRTEIPGQGMLRALLVDEDGRGALCGTAAQRIVHVDLSPPEPPPPDATEFTSSRCTLPGEKGRAHGGAVRGLARAPGRVWSLASSDWDQAPLAQVHRWTPRGVEDDGWASHPAATLARARRDRRPGVPGPEPKEHGTIPSNLDEGDPCTLDVSPGGELLVIGMWGGDVQVWVLE